MNQYIFVLLLSVFLVNPTETKAEWSCECDDIEGWTHVTTGSSCELDEPVCGQCSYEFDYETGPSKFASGTCTPVAVTLSCLCELSPADQALFDSCRQDPDCSIYIDENCGFPNCVSDNPVPPGPATGSCNYIQARPPIAYLNDQDNCVPVNNP